MTDIKGALCMSMQGWFFKVKKAKKPRHVHVGVFRSNTLL